MEEAKAKRSHRTPEEKAAEVDTKIQRLNVELAAIEAKRVAANEDFDKKAAAVKERIAVLEEHKKEILAPKPPKKPRKTKKQKIQELLNRATKSGMKPEEIAERLGLAQEEE